MACDKEDGNSKGDVSVLAGTLSHVAALFVEQPGRYWMRQSPQLNKLAAPAAEQAAT